MVTVVYLFLLGGIYNADLSRLKFSPNATTQVRNQPGTKYMESAPGVAKLIL